MISVEQARERILAALLPAGGEIVSLAAAYQRVLASPVVARLTQPPADVSAMDGYALRATDGYAGATLNIIGAAPAGRPFTGGLGAGEAVRIFTGSVIPAGADCVLIQEDAAVAGSVLSVHAPCRAGRHIRPAGQDFAAGEVLIAAGRRLSARDIGLAAAGGHPWLNVHRRPRIAILTTGDEISLPGEPVGPGGIAGSNAPMLAALIAASGAEAVVLPVAGDDRAAIAAGADAAKGADLLVTTGGASVGAHDLVQSGLELLGFKLDFWKIAMRPGKPLIFGHVGALPMLGLPGNPVSAFVCAWLFLRPAIERLAGLPDAPPVAQWARLGAPMAANDPRADYVRAVLTYDAQGWVVTPSPRQDSGMLRVLARADALVIRPPHAPAVEAGEKVPFIRLEC